MSVYKYRRELLETLPKLGFLDGLGVIFLYAILSPWAVEPKKSKKVRLAPRRLQKAVSRGIDDIPVELLVASRTEITPGRYLASSDGKCWQWFNFVARENGWQHEIIHPSISKCDTAGAVALVVVGVALVATIAIVALSLIFR